MVVLGAAFWWKLFARLECDGRGRQIEFTIGLFVSFWLLLERGLDVVVGILERRVFDLLTQRRPRHPAASTKILARVTRGSRVQTQRQVLHQRAVLLTSCVVCGRFAVDVFCIMTRCSR